MENTERKQNGPPLLVNMQQPWPTQYEHYDIFFDSFSQLLVLHSNACFVICEEFEAARKETRLPVVHNLAFEQ